MKDKVVIVTGAAHRVGASIVRKLHKSDAKIALHYRNSFEMAQKIADELNAERAESVYLISGDLNCDSVYETLIKSVASHFGRIDVLINNASSFYPTEIGATKLEDWNDLMASNLKAPFFLAQAANPFLQETQGCIVNIVDIHAEKPLKNHPVYCMAKAGLVMMTKSLAKELGPKVRVNAVAPGAILWPEGMDQLVKDEILSRTALKCSGSPDDIATTTLFLLRDAPYMTGQVLAVDGGRSLNL